MNLIEQLRRATAEHPQRPALIFVGAGSGSTSDRQSDDLSVSFGQLDAWSARIAGGLGSLGIGPGSRVVVLAPLSPELYAGLIALWRLGAVAVFMDPWAGRAALAQSARATRADALIAGRAARAIRLFSPALRRIPLVVRSDGNGATSLVHLAAKGPPRHAIADVTPDHPALITFTSGSTAASHSPLPSAWSLPSESPLRGVVRTHGVLEAQHRAIARTLPQRASDVDLTTFPVLVLHNLAGGVPTVILPRRARRGDRAEAAATVLAALERTGCSTAAAAPGFWRELAQAAVTAGRTLTLRRIVVGGAVVGAPLLEALGQVAPGAQIIAVYGSSEVEPVATITAAHVLALATRTAAGAGVPLGLPVPEAAVSIMDNEGREQKVGVPGEIWVAGDHVAAGYLGGAAVDAPHKCYDADGRLWHRMGDAGYRDEAGRLWIVGRTHTLLRKAGLVVYPVPVEAAVEALHFVARAALTAEPFLEQADGEDDRLVLAVQPRDGATLPPGWAAEVNRRVSALAGDPATVVDGGEFRGASLGAVPDEVIAIKLIPVDARHSSRVDQVQLRRRLIDRRRGRHLRAWLAERFPPLQHGLLITSYFGANALLAQATVGRATLSLGRREVAGALVLLCMFFLLRVIDEHKDFAADTQVHPRRVLSRGLVTLGQLRRLAAAALGLELLLAWSLGPSAIAGCLLVVGVSGLIARDFFLAAFLEARMLLGALVHLLIMPLYSLFIFSAVTGQALSAAPTPVLLYAWVGYAVALAYELARKTRTPQEERPGLVTYSRRMGPFRPAWLALAAVSVGAALSWRVGALLGLGRWYHGTVVALVFLVAVGVLDYRLRPTPARAARLKDYAGLYIFAFDVLLAVELARVNGLAIG